MTDSIKIRLGLLKAYKLNSDINRNKDGKFLGDDELVLCNQPWIPLYQAQIFWAEDIKGQLISKCPFGVFKSSKKPTKNIPGFLS